MHRDVDGPRGGLAEAPAHDFDYASGPKRLARRLIRVPPVDCRNEECDEVMDGVV